MLTIPKSVTITRSREEEETLYEMAAQWLSKDERVPGVHASGLLDPLQAYWQHKKPLPLSRRDIGIFLVGKVLHVLVLGVGGSDEGSFYSKELDLWFSPDKIREGGVKELKTSRSLYEPKSQGELSIYMEQILIYMVAANVLEASLWVLYINLRDEDGRTCPEFRAYKMRVSEEDLAKAKAEMRETRDKLQKAIDTNNPSELPLCRDFKCGAKGCKWYYDCQPPGRWGRKEYDR